MAPVRVTVKRGSVRRQKASARPCNHQMDPKPRVNCDAKPEQLAEVSATQPSRRRCRSLSRPYHHPHLPWQSGRSWNHSTFVAENFGVLTSTSISSAYVDGWPRSRLEPAKPFLNGRVRDGHGALTLRAGLSQGRAECVTPGQIFGGQARQPNARSVFTRSQPKRESLLHGLGVAEKARLFKHRLTLPPLLLTFELYAGPARGTAGRQEQEQEETRPGEVTAGGT